jgi:hypothetical protein
MQTYSLKGEDLNMVHTSLVELYKTENDVLRYLTETRGISKEVLMFYRIGKKQEKFRQLDGKYDYDDCVVFPIYGRKKGQPDHHEFVEGNSFI